MTNKSEPKETFTERVMTFFRAHPNQWINATRFESIGGRQAWRTRIAEARQRFVQANEGEVENQVARCRRPTGERYTLSRYRFVPRVRTEPSEKPHDLNEWSLRGSR